jgi:predicted metal-dependent hydrolase
VVAEPKAAVPELPAALLRGAALFDRGAYLEAHEAWEEYWAAHGGRGAALYKGLIQVAVALHHWEHGNAHGARKLHRKGVELLRPFAPRHAGLDLASFVTALDAFFAPLHAAFERRLPSPPMPAAGRPRLNPAS